MTTQVVKMRISGTVQKYVMGALLLAATLATADEYTENFDGAGWNVVFPFSASTQTNNGWEVHNGAVMSASSGFWTAPDTAPNSAWLDALSQSPDTYIQSPLLTNGVGTLVLAAQCKNSVPQAYTVRVSTNAVDWDHVVTVTNTSTAAWSTDEVVINRYQPVYVKIEKAEDDGNSGRFLGIDTISMAAPPSYVEVTNPQLSPTSPYILQSTMVSATITPFENADITSTRVFYSTNGGASYASINMLEGVNNYYETTSPGIPAQTIPGLTVDYYIRTVFNSQDSTTRTNYWPASAPGATTNFVVDWGSAFAFADTNWNTFALNNGLIYQGDAWLNVLGQGSGTPAIASQTPYANGVGTVTVQTRNNLSTNPITFDIQLSTNGTTWDITAATFTNTSLSATEHVIDIDFYESAYVRLKLTDDDATAYHHLVAESFTVTEPSSFVTFSNVVFDPAQPITGTNTMVSVTILPEAGANNIQARLYYATSAGTPFSSYVDMELIGPNRYQTVDGIPAFDTAGQRIYYYFYASFLGLEPNSPQTQPETGAYSFLLGAAPPEAVYTNMTVHWSSLSTNMFLAQDYTWQGAIDPNGTIGAPSTFHYASGGNTWGDGDQAMTTTPIYGDAEAGQNVDISEAISSYLIFTFTDGPAASNRTYSAARGAYVNFNEWTGAGGAYSAYTNADGWVAHGARMSTPDSNEVARALDDTFLIIKHGEPGQNLVSPEMTTGAGSISFWYRSWYTDGSEPSTFSIETSTNGSDWFTIETVTNVLSTDWLYHRTALASPAIRYVRVQQIDATSDSWLCLDEVAVTEPGAYVTLSNPQVSPASPIQGDPVDASIDIVSNGGATNETCVLYYRAGTSAPFTATSTTLAGGTFTGSIPPSPPSTIQYYFACSYDGFSAATTYYPAAGSSAPLEFSVSGDLPSSRVQNFDDGWTSVFPFTAGSQTNDGWVISDCSVMAAGFWTPPQSDPYACWMDDLVDDDGVPGNPWITSPVISNGIGSISFVSHDRKFNAGYTPQTIYIEIQPTGQTEWQHLGTVVDSGADQWNTNSLYLNSYQDGKIRIFKAGDDNIDAQYLGIDDIRITYPPSDIALTNVYFEPAYPAQNQEVKVYCEIAQINPNYPAFGFSPVIYHRQTGATSWNTSPMNLISGTSYTGTIPAYGAGIVEYYVRCEFDGVFFEEGNYTENRSPAFSPAASHTNSLPDTFHSYNVRYFRSDYDTVAITGNFETVESTLIGNDWWQGAFYTDPTNHLIIGLDGTGFAENSQADPSSTLWGDSNQWQTDIPAAGTLEVGGSNIVMNGSFDGLYLFRFDIRTGDYMILRADWQDFNTWPLSASFFTEGSQGRQSQGLLQTFNDWDLSSDNSVISDFEGPWVPTNNNVYVDYSEYGNGEFIIKNAKIANSNGNFRAQLIPAPNTGLIYLSDLKLPSMIGSGSASFRYRVRDESTHITTYDQGANWTNYTVVANVEGQGDNTDDGSYWSIIYRYQGPGTFYEMRVVAINQNQLFMEIVKHSGGSTSTIATGAPFSGSLNSGGEIKVTVATDGSAQVDHRGYYEGTQRVVKLDETSGISKGSIGLSAYDVNMLVNDVKVAAYGYEEFFGSPPANWTGDGSWTQDAGYYRRVGRYAPGDPLSFGVYTCHKNDINASSTFWTSHRIFSDVTTLSYVSTTVPTQIPEADYLTVIKHLDGTDSLRFANLTVTSWRGEDATYNTADGDWVMNDGFISTTTPDDEKNLELRASRGLYTTNFAQSLRSPRMETVGPVAFRYRTPAGTPAPEVAFRFAPEAQPGNFSTVTNVTLPVSEEWTSYAYPLNLSSTGFVQIAHVSSNMDARLFLDNVSIFDFSANDTNSWIAYNALLTDEQQDKLYLNEGRSAYLNYDDDTDTLYDRVYTNMAYIQTPYMADGVGEISFWYRRWEIPGGLSKGVLVVEKSADTVTWEPVTTIDVTSDTYTYYAFNDYDQANHYVRFRNDFSEGVPDRICLDNILVASPIATSLSITNAWTVPEYPTYTNAVKIRAALSDFILSPTGIQVRAYYHIGSNEWATWNEDINSSLAMIKVDEDTNATPPVFIYETIGSIDPQPINKVVQYTVRADFDGVINADATSPQRFKDDFENPSEYEPVNYNSTYGGDTNITPYYVSFSCPAGSVWINELNVHQMASQWGDNEYIEVCGRANTDLSGWKVRIVTTSYTTHDAYTLPAGTILGSETNGFGFWVLGDTTVVPYPDMVFTNAKGVFNMNLPYPDGGIELLRGMGARAHAISYGTYAGYAGALAMEANGFDYVGQDLYYAYSAIAMTGTGSSKDDFAWSTSGQGHTPGSINPFQTLLGNDVAIATAILLSGIWSDTSYTWIAFEVEPSDRTLSSATAWYCTDLLSTNWTPTTGNSYSGSGGSYTQRFNVVTNRPAFFQLRVQDNQ